MYLFIFYYYSEPEFDIISICLNFKLTGVMLLAQDFNVVDPVEAFGVMLKLNIQSYVSYKI